MPVLAESPDDEQSAGGSYTARSYQYGGEADTGSKGTYRAHYEPDGDYRQPMDIEFIDDTHALVTTKLSGEIFELDLVAKSLTVAHREPNCSWGDATRVNEDLVAVAERNAEQIVVFRKTQQVWTPTASLEAVGQPHSLVWDRSARNSVCHRTLVSTTLSLALGKGDLAGHRAVDELAYCRLEYVRRKDFAPAKAPVSDDYRCVWSQLPHVDQQTGEVLKRDKALRSQYCHVGGHAE